MKKGCWFYLKCIYGKVFMEKFFFGYKICRVFLVNNLVFIFLELVERRVVWG